MAMGMKELIEDARSRIEEIDPEAAESELRVNPATLALDVREAEEFSLGHLPDALLIPRGMLEPKAALDSPARDPQLSDPERPIIAYCGSGARSALAAATLQQLGFSQVRSLAGGIEAWTQEGRPIVR
jgi:rhodanese-related sulfurtransferase